jgi:hypothetical protein
MCIRRRRRRRTRRRCTSKVVPRHHMPRQFDDVSSPDFEKRPDMEWKLISAWIKGEKEKSRPMLDKYLFVV